MKTRFSRPLRGIAAVSLLAALVAGCNSDSEPGPRASINRVVVAGDSLADIGALGVKATVQNSADPVAGFPLYPQLVAQNFGIESQCNFYVVADSAAGIFTDNPVAGCSNFAVGGGRIVNAASRGGAESAYNIPTQLARAAAVNGGWSASDLLLVDGGGNDLADLTSAYIGAGRGAVSAYRDFLLQQLDAAIVDPLLAQGAVGFAQAAGLYMQTLADTYYGAIKSEGLDRGATRVAVLNVPDITLTPRFRMVLGAVAQSSGAAQADALTMAIRQWAGAFNARLQSHVAGDARVALVDFYADLTDQVTHAAQYGASNATSAACPVTGVDGSGLPTYSFPVCQSTALDTADNPDTTEREGFLPAGASPGWWRTWTFSDGFHPSPYGHRLLASSISRALARAGWL